MNRGSAQNPFDKWMVNHAHLLVKLNPPIHKKSESEQKSVFSVFSATA